MIENIFAHGVVFQIQRHHRGVTLTLAAAVAFCGVAMLLQAEMDGIPAAGLTGTAAIFKCLEKFVTQKRVT